MKYLVTGAAGFIGAHVAKALAERGDHVVGLDNLNDYYAVSLKQDRLSTLLNHPAFSFRQIDITDKTALTELIVAEKPERVIHMAAQAGVRYSLEHPQLYADTNVYGNNRKQPYSEQDKTDQPVSLYGATKKSNELMAHAYAHLFQIPSTGVRFFTVYGPWGRPDMAPMKFLRKMLAGEPIDVYNGGAHRRDFTYIDDVVEGVLRVSDRPAGSDEGGVRHAVYNIGNSQPVQLESFIDLLEQYAGCKVTRNSLPMQPGDVEDTYADVSALERDVGYQPSTSIEAGVQKLVTWYRSYYFGESVSEGKR